MPNYKSVCANRYAQYSSILLLLTTLIVTFNPFSVGKLNARVASAQQMDAQLNMAKRSVEQIEQRLQQLKQGDVAQYNKLSEQLNKAAEQLKSTSSQAHPDFQVTVQKWSALRTQMMNIAQTWQSTQTAQAAQNQTETSAQAKGAAAAGTETSATNAVDANAILAKYQRENRPKLGNYPNPSEVSEWAAKMKALQTTELQADLAILNSPSVSASDRSRVSRWISGDFQNQINQDIQAAMQRFNGESATAVQLGQQIQNIDLSNKMRAYNFANGENGRRNAQTLDAGLVAAANGMALDEAFPSIANASRQQEIGIIAMAQQTLQEMSEIAKQQDIELAKTPKKETPKKGPFLKGIAQELWYKGSVMASLDRKGSIWMNSQDVGDITSSGRIWVFSNDLGSLERDGKVWFRGNHIGTIEDNGKVWRNGTQVGSVVDGKVWIDGNQNGEIVAYEGEWKRAAVVYFFRDLFRAQ